MKTNWRSFIGGGIKWGACLLLGVTLFGCVGYVGPGPGPAVVVGGGVWGDPYVGWHDAHDWGHRGFVSRGFAHHR